MSGLLSRAGELFVAPAQARQAVVAAPARSAAVLARAADLHVAAGALAGGVAIVCSWPPLPPRPFPPSPAARRLTEWLARRDLDAAASGRVAHVALPADPGDARPIAERLLGWAEVPVVVAMWVRDPALDPVLRAVDTLALALPADDAVAQLIAEELAQAGRAPWWLAVPGSPSARLASRLGLARLRPDARTVTA